jgi:ABC-type antimicrobial peptide transport system permease subunit
MNIIRFTLIDIWRTKVFLGILFLSLLVAFTSVSYLYFYGERVQKRFESMPEIANMIIGAKTSDHKILLGALAGVDYDKGFVPYTLYKSFQDNMSVKHGDGALTSTGYITRVIPILYIDKIKEWNVVASNKDLFSEIDASGEIVMGINAAKGLGLKESDELFIPHLNRKIKVKKILKTTDTIWDNQIFLDIEFYYSFGLKPSDANTIWGNRVLHYMLASVKDESIEEFRSLVNQRTVAQIVVKNEVLEDINKLLSGEKKIIGLMANLIIFLSVLSMITIFLVVGSYKKTILQSLKLIGFSKRERATYVGLELSFVIILPLILGVYLGHILLVLIFPSSLF